MPARVPPAVRNEPPPLRIWRRGPAPRLRLGRLERLPELHPVPVAVLDPGEATIALVLALRVDPDASGGEIHQEGVEVVDAVVDHLRLIPLTEVGRILREWIPGRH